MSDSNLYSFRLQTCENQMLHNCYRIVPLCHNVHILLKQYKLWSIYIYTDWRLIIACIFYHLSFSFYVSFLLFFLKFWFVIYAANTCISVYPLSNDIHFFIFNCNMIIFPYDWINIKKNRYWIFVICKALS